MHRKDKKLKNRLYKKWRGVGKVSAKTFNRKWKHCKAALTSELRGLNDEGRRFNHHKLYIQHFTG